MTLHVERLTGPESLDALRAEWEALHAQLIPATPFTSPLWNGLWWQHLSEQQPWVRDEFFVHIVRDERRALVAVAPMMVTHRPSTGALRLRELQFFGADSNLTEIRGLVCRPADHDAVIAALRQHFQAQQGSWHRILWSGIPEQSRGKMQQDSDAPVVWRKSTVGHYVTLPDSWEEMKSQLSRNMKEALRKCYNPLRRDGHEFVFRVVSEPAQAVIAIEHLIRLHKVRASAPDMVRHPDSFESAAARGFFTDYALQMAERGQLTVFQLEIAGEIVATRAAFLFGDEMYLSYSGYEPAWGRYSIMTTLVAEVFKWAIANKLSGVNLSTGSDASKTRWKPTEIVLWEGTQKSTSYIDRLVPFAYDHLVRAAPHATSLMWLVLPHIRRHR
jgi:CelD/BcsL family acetyltransferase involved in cellulose biosynthesis